MTMHPGARLRARVEEGVVQIPGAFNALVAREIAKAGFDACYLSGGATANVAGLPDVGLLTMTEVTRTIRQIVDASKLPVIADADTGYGEEEASVRTVVEYERAGAAGLHVEDQVFPKRCGHLDGKQVVGVDVMAQKVQAMAGARASDDFIIIARTDARHVTDIDDAIARGNAYREAGADAIFPEGLTSPEEFAAFAKGSPGLLLANMTEFGKTPHISVDDFGALGYRMVIYPLSLMRLAMACVVEGLDVLKREGSLESIENRMQHRSELYETLDYRPGEPWSFSENST